MMNDKDIEPGNEEPTRGADGKKLTRRAMLAKLGLLGAAVYAAPVLLNLSDAEADRSRSRSNNRGRNRRRNRWRNRNRARNRSRSRSRD
jgi:hypothetical protein